MPGGDSGYFNFAGAKLKFRNDDGGTMEGDDEGDDGDDDEDFFAGRL